MLELTVTAPRPCQIPTVVCKKFEDVPYLHEANNKLFGGLEEDIQDKCRTRIGSDGMLFSLSCDDVVCATVTRKVSALLLSREFALFFRDSNFLHH